MSVRLHQLLDNVLSLPGLLQWRMRRFDADFRRGQYGGVCRGVYKTYQEAAQGAPSTLPLGYNHEAPTTMYRDRLTRVWPSDYAMMLWLIKIFQEGATRVFDLGGHVGVSYYAYQKYIDYPSELVWQLLDVPSVAVAGRQIALEHDGRRSLNFVDDFASASEADVLFTSGCLQYLEDTLAEKLALLPQQPQWVLVNLLPLHDSLEY